MMMIHLGASAAGAMSPQMIAGINGRFMNAFGGRLLAGYDRKMAQVAARKPAAKAKATPKPVAKPAAAAPKPQRPMTHALRAAWLRQAEADVRAHTHDARCCYTDMKAGR
jgi:hypothetical protein